MNTLFSRHFHNLLSSGSVCVRGKSSSKTVLRESGKSGEGRGVALYSSKAESIGRNEHFRVFMTDDHYGERKGRGPRAVMCVIIYYSVDHYALFSKFSRFVSFSVRPVAIVRKLAHRKTNGKPSSFRDARHMRRTERRPGDTREPSAGNGRAHYSRTKNARMEIPTAVRVSSSVVHTLASFRSRAVKLAT